MKPNVFSTKKSSIIVGMAITGIIVAFMSIYKYAHNGQPVRAVWAGGIALFFFTFALATQLAIMRQGKK